MTGSDSHVLMMDHGGGGGSGRCVGCVFVVRWGNSFWCLEMGVTVKNAGLFIGSLQMGKDVIEVYFVCVFS